MNTPSFTARALHDSTTRTVRLVLSGELDIGTEPDVIAAVTAAITAADTETLIVDVTGVPFMDSSGLRALLLSRTAAQESGLAFQLAVRPGPVTRLLEISGVGDWFSYAP